MNSGLIIATVVAGVFVFEAAVLLIARKVRIKEPPISIGDMETRRGGNSTIVKQDPAVTASDGVEYLKIDTQKMHVSREMRIDKEWFNERTKQ